ncbi:MAG: TfoX/Sxy family protein [Treponema sp.]|nr:TfoX/Sxy family protein [Treponema sp.]
MASTKEYLDFVLEQLSLLDDITCKAMMGEYIIYYRGKIIGGVYDNRFLVKNVKSARGKMPEAALELPYEGAREMLLVDEVENREFLKELFDAMFDELPELKKRK